MRSSWHSLLIRRLTEYAKQELGIRVFATFGSMHAGTYDQWSDVDALLVVDEKTLPVFFDPAWLAQFGRILATEQYDHGHLRVLRACFCDFRRLDLLLVTVESLQRIEEWPSPPPWHELSIHYADSQTLSTLLHQLKGVISFTAPSADEFEQIVNQFWFKVAVALYKIVRDDLLIALHLTLDLIRECTVLGMMIRDRAEQTNQHRVGGIGNEIVKQLPIVSSPYSAASLLEAIVACSEQFDQLATTWSNAYQVRSRYLTDHIVTIREHLTLR